MGDLATRLGVLRGQTELLKADFLNNIVADLVDIVSALEAQVAETQTLTELQRMSEEPDAVAASVGAPVCSTCNGTGRVPSVASPLSEIPCHCDPKWGERFFSAPGTPYQIASELALDAAIKEAEQRGYRAGQEAMRERAAKECQDYHEARSDAGDHPLYCDDCGGFDRKHRDDCIVEDIRTLPIEEP